LIRHADIPSSTVFPYDFSKDLKGRKSKPLGIRYYEVENPP
jgi:hypothetical protein